MLPPLALACFFTFVGWLRVKHASFMTWSGIISTCLGLLIGCFPVGLPLCVTATLLIVAKRMAKANVLVKDLTIIETLGSINMIASDKTGTLTQNNMSVVEALLGTKRVLNTTAGFVQTWKDIPEQFAPLLSIAVHNNAYVELHHGF